MHIKPTPCFWASIISWSWCYTTVMMLLILGQSARIKWETTAGASNKSTARLREIHLCQAFVLPPPFPMNYIQYKKSVSKLVACHFKCCFFSPLLSVYFQKNVIRATVVSSRWSYALSFFSCVATDGLWRCTELCKIHMLAATTRIAYVSVRTHHQSIH